MFNTIFNKESVKIFLRKIIKGEVYKDKEFPKTICEEKIDDSFYSLFIGLDAIIKYSIIVDDINMLHEYITQVELLLRKISNHNEIVIGINKLLINFSKIKLGIKDINIKENKEEILRYIYRKYIVEGYYFHSFPSVFLEEVTHNGLFSKNYFYEIDSVKDVNNVFKKYNLNNVFSKDLENTKPYISACDTPFMGCFYAYHSPYFLNEVCIDLVEKNKNYQLDPLFKKDYKRCKKNLAYLQRKEGMFNSDINAINSFFSKEWDIFNLNESIPVMAAIKRKDIGINYLDEIHSIIENSSDLDLITSVTKILEIKNNHLEIYQDLLPQSFEVLYLPTLEELGFNILEENKKHGVDEQLPVIDSTKDVIVDEHGNTTIIALLGVLLITIGMTITLIMLGR